MINQILNMYEKWVSMKKLLNILRGII